MKGHNLTGIAPCTLPHYSKPIPGPAMSIDTKTQLMLAHMSGNEEFQTDDEMLV